MAFDRPRIRETEEQVPDRAYDDDDYRRSGPQMADDEVEPYWDQPSPEADLDNGYRGGPQITSLEPDPGWEEPNPATRRDADRQALADRVPGPIEDDLPAADNPPAVDRSERQLDGQAHSVGRQPEGRNEPNAVHPVAQPAPQPSVQPAPQQQQPPARPIQQPAAAEQPQLRQPQLRQPQLQQPQPQHQPQQPQRQPELQQPQRQPQPQVQQPPRQQAQAQQPQQPQVQQPGSGQGSQRADGRRGYDLSPAAAAARAEAQAAQWIATAEATQASLLDGQAAMRVGIAPGRQTEAPENQSQQAQPSTSEPPTRPRRYNTSYNQQRPVNER